MSVPADDPIATLEECYRRGLMEFVRYAKLNWKLEAPDMKDIKEGEDFRKGWNAALDGLGGCLDSFFEEYQY